MGRGIVGIATKGLLVVCLPRNSNNTSVRLETALWRLDQSQRDALARQIRLGKPTQPRPVRWPSVLTQPWRKPKPSPHWKTSSRNFSCLSADSRQMPQKRSPKTRDMMNWTSSTYLHQACWPTSSRHARLSAACLVGATNDNNLSDGSKSMSIKTEIISLRLAKEIKQDSPWPMSRERHVSCRILCDPICYSPDPNVVYLTSSERSHILWEVLRMGQSLNWIFHGFQYVWSDIFALIPMEISCGVKGIFPQWGGDTWCHCYLSVDICWISTSHV